MASDWMDKFLSWSLNVYPKKYGELWKKEQLKTWSLVREASLCSFVAISVLISFFSLILTLTAIDVVFLLQQSLWFFSLAVFLPAFILFSFFASSLFFRLQDMLLIRVWGREGFSARVEVKLAPYISRFMKRFLGVLLVPCAFIVLLQGFISPWLLVTFVTFWLSIWVLVLALHLAVENEKAYKKYRISEKKVNAIARSNGLSLLLSASWCGLLVIVFSYLFYATTVGLFDLLVRPNPLHQWFLPIDSVVSEVGSISVLLRNISISFLPILLILLLFYSYIIPTLYLRNKEAIYVASIAFAISGIVEAGITIGMNLQSMIQEPLAVAISSFILSYIVAKHFEGKIELLFKKCPFCRRTFRVIHLKQHEKTCPRMREKVKKLKKFVE